MQSGAAFARLPAARAAVPRRAAAGRTLRSRPLCQAAAEGTKTAAKKPPNPITLSENALAHLRKLRAEQGGEGLLLRMGVKSGGCSGMSYVMDFEQEANIKPDDLQMNFEGDFRLVCDPKSLLYLFGMELDYSNALVKDSLDPGTQQVETQAQPTPHRPAGGARVLETAAAAA